MTIPEPAELLVPPHAADAPAVAATGTRRLMGGLIGTNAAAYISTAVPTNLLLATHLTVIAGAQATSAFSVVIGIGGIAAIIANPLGGRISDRTAIRFGRRRTWIATGGLGVAILLLAIAFTTQIWEVAAAWAILQLLVQFQLAASSALAADQVLPTRRGAVSGVVAFVSLAGPIIGFGLASAVAATPVLQWVVVAVLSAAGVLMTVLLVRDPQHHAPAGEKFGLRAIVRTYWVSPRKHPAFAWAWWVRLLITAAWSANAYFAFVFTQRFGVSTKDVASKIFLLTLIAIVCVAVTAWLTGWLSDKLRRQKPFIMAGALILAVGLVVMASAPSVTFVYVGASIMSLGYGTFLATDFAMCIRMLPDPESAGKDFGVLNIANTLPAVIVPFLATLLLGIGGFAALFIAMAVVSLAGAAAVFRIPDIGQEGDARFAAMDGAARDGVAKGA